MKSLRESMAMDLSVIIVSYNTADLLIRCLSSVERAEGIETETFVVDNASDDGSADRVRQRHPKVHLIENRENRGFSSANNQALALCRGNFVLFLNPDTEIEPGALKTSVAFMQANPGVGLAGFKILNPDRTLQESISWRYPGEKYGHDDLPPRLPGKIACVLGAAMIAREEVIRKIGGFDEDYFLYGEDEDLCLRVRKAGWEIDYIEEARVTHWGGQSELRTVSAEKWRKKLRAEYLFYTKHYRPETIGRIRRLDRLKARWRLLTLSLGMPFSGNREHAEEKRSRYRVILEETDRGLPATRP